MTSASNESSSAAKPFWDAAASEQIESWNEASSWGDNASRPSFPIWLCLRIKLVQTSEKLLCRKTIQLPSWKMCVTITPNSQTWGARVAQRWEHSSPTNVAQVHIPTLTPCVLREFFIRALWFSYLLKKPILQHSNSVWNAPAHLNEFLRTPKYFVSKQITNCFFSYQHHNPHYKHVHIIMVRTLCLMNWLERSTV